MDGVVNTIMVKIGRSLSLMIRDKRRNLMRVSPFIIRRRSAAEVDSKYRMAIGAIRQKPKKQQVRSSIVLLFGKIRQNFRNFLFRLT
ncbi:MAG: hypothetical protein COT39_01900 [Parcubacteria group bacterium CG08_land_8_20_14_0_20_48_21]|nr:MAG: hypothetical protein AUK21_03115 [Parcubacteria group bacterium CG2_30_48_51]PIS32933.1 MAG: hypothetical protein COT39_01900 [Parcubacteria group bacterium CG08_land_8_20_14_0_20_48_21]PIW79170.1 MAG: hypothetical protein COZ99_02715 [Parcubacteria group bacterium CG_4_8_14_3_um_filter_48_16]PIY77817.1 MAG: hypothetical protein COY83_03375 [Parcubacteria group bacterium CG_4_10_14_0_8_um_filter_48_154]PIZ77969.1 MAG: hypothetical protein COY03_00730 [bacterium CG_4_10_14_0_2_um_filter_